MDLNAPPAGRKTTVWSDRCYLCHRPAKLFPRSPRARAARKGEAREAAARDGRWDDTCGPTGAKVARVAHGSALVLRESFPRGYLRRGNG